MKRLLFAVAIALMLAGTSVFAAQSGAKPPKPQGPAAAAKAPKPVSPKPAAPKAAAPKTVAPSPKPAPRMVNASPKPSSPKTAPAPAPASPAKTAKKAETPVVTAKADAKPPKADSKVKVDAKAEPAVKTETKVRASSKTTIAPGAPLTPIQEKLTKSTNLARKLESRLPAGTNVLAASEGFKNLGQFVAAVNVSNNLNIPFDKLKEKMVKDNKSLGQAIQALRPTSSGTIEAQRAEYDARGMIAESERELEVAASKKPAPAKPAKPSASPRATGGRP